jgi:hypothetical protein
MSHFDWRSPETYDRTLEFEPTGFAWECLRRNPEYHYDYRVLASSDPDPSVMTAFRKRWGLCFRS